MTSPGGPARAAVLAVLLVALAGCGGGGDEPATRTFTVSGPAMEPTFVQGQTFTIHDKASGDLAVGDVVVLADPGGWLGESVKGGHLLKRVLGVGGDTVSCDPARAGGKVVVDDVPLDETSYLPKGVAPCDFPFSVKVPSGHLWLLGDNRPNSADSRAHLVEPQHGFVETKDVEGVVLP